LSEIPILQEVNGPSPAYNRRMKNMRHIRVLSVPLFVIVVTTLVFSSEDVSTLSGTVTDQLGAVIPGAKLFIHWNTPRSMGPKEPVKYDDLVVTDTAGKFSIPLRPGFYDVCVHARAFSPACKTLALSRGMDSTYNPALEINRVIVEEFGDEFPPMPVKPIPSEIPKLLPLPK